MLVCLYIYIPFISNYVLSHLWWIFPEEDPNLIFLDTAASALKPNKMIQAVNNCYSNEYANIHRGIYSLSANLTKKFEDVRKKVSNFIKLYKSSTEKLGFFYCNFPAIITFSITLCPKQ